MRFGIPSGISLYCQKCDKVVETTVENGEKIYPHRPDLYDGVYLQCPHCGNYVGADGFRSGDTARSWTKRHEKKVIPSKEMRRNRQLCHSIIDPLWREGIFTRKYIYKRLNKATGINFHNSSLYDEEVAKKALEEAKKLKQEAEILAGRPIGHSLRTLGK